MDADLQDDPAELVRLIKKLDEGYDVVSGWKKKRHDPLSKRLPSKLFNHVVSRVYGLTLHDMNCGLKVYRRKAVEHLHIYGELYRFAPALLFAQGFRVAELAVEHHPRLHGHSKYGSSRLAKGMLDMITVVLLTRYRARPLHLFGFVGLPMVALGGIILLYLTVLWFAGLGPIGDRPLLILGVLMVITGIQFVGIGLIAELLLASETGSEDRYVVESILSAEGLPASDRDVRVEA
jgi:glycosyltransferase involved in cell wall biosynthesis